METRIEGIETIVERIEGIADAKALVAAMQKCCALVEGEAKKKAPKDTGALRNSIASRVENTENELRGVIYTPLEYAPYVEYGTGLFAENGGRKTPWIYEDEETGEKIFTRGQHPQPFLRPALNENREKIIELLKRSVNND
jgi:HK97 gp10 family phage protein